MTKQVVTLPYHVKESAELSADEELRQAGKESNRSSPAWKKAFDRYVREAYESTFVPAKNNPGTPKETPFVLEDNFPEIWGENGFIAQVTGKEPTSAEWKNVDGRIRGAVTNLLQLHMDIVMGFKTKRSKNNSDLSKKEELSAFEFAAKGEKDQQTISRENMATLSARYYRYLVSEVCYELLLPLLQFTRDDAIEIMKNVQEGSQNFTYEALKSKEGGAAFVMALRNRIKRWVLRAPSIKKLFLP